MAKQHIQIAHSPDNTLMALITNTTIYAFPMDDIPQIVDALRAAAENRWTIDYDLRVFPTEDGRVAITEVPATIETVENNRALLESGMAYVHPKHESARLAEGFEKVYDEVKGTRH